MSYSKTQRIARIEGKIAALVKRIASTHDSRIPAAELAKLQRELADMKR